MQAALAGLAFAILPHRGESDETAEFDLVASLVLLGFALLAIVGGALDVSVRSSWVLAAAAAVAILAFVGAQVPSAAAGCGAAGLVALAAMRLWPFARTAADGLGAASRVVIEHGPGRIELTPLDFLFAAFWPPPQGSSGSKIKAP